MKIAVYIALIEIYISKTYKYGVLTENDVMTLLDFQRVNIH